MSSRRKRKTKKWKRVLMTPFYSIFSSFSGVFDGLGGLLGFGGPKLRRNRDFERAGRERRGRRQIDEEAVSDLNNATKVRDDEIIRAVRMEKKLMQLKGEEGRIYRREKALENQSVSKGKVINHLARMQRKAAEKKSSEAKVEASNGSVATPGSSQSPSDRTKSELGLADLKVMRGDAGSSQVVPGKISQKIEGDRPPVGSSDGEDNSASR